MDEVRVLWEGLAVLRLGRCFLLLLAIMQIELQQFAEQVRTLRFGRLPQVLLHTGSLPGQPGCLEAVADFIHVPARCRRPRTSARLGGLAHDVNSFSQASRTIRSIRSIATGVQPWRRFRTSPTRRPEGRRFASVEPAKPVSDRADPGQVCSPLGGSVMVGLRHECKAGGRGLQAFGTPAAERAVPAGVLFAVMLAA